MANRAILAAARASAFSAAAPRRGNSSTAPPLCLPREVILSSIRQAGCRRVYRYFNVSPRYAMEDVYQRYARVSRPSFCTLVVAFRPFCLLGFRISSRASIEYDREYAPKLGASTSVTFTGHVIHYGCSLFNVDSYARLRHFSTTGQIYIGLLHDRKSSSILRNDIIPTNQWYELLEMLLIFGNR